MRIELWVNGAGTEVEAAPGEMLADVLRYRLGLTGTKVGCNEDECGACTVLLDGAAVLSCNYPALKAAGKQVVTIEGLASDGRLHPLQEAFIKHGAVQCGFCIPGQIMTAAALLAENPDPSEEQIRKALKSALCRCGAYPTIVRAVQAAARSLRTGEPIPEPGQPLTTPSEVVGQAVRRPDAVDKVTGRARFADDYVFPSMLYGRTLRAGVPHAILRLLDVEKARAFPGVRAVLTAADIPGEHYHGVIRHDWPVLVGVGEKVRYVGDAVALVAAESEHAADEALQLIETEYEALPVVPDAVSARQAGAAEVHEGGNLLKHIKVRKGDPEQGFRQADLVLEHAYETPTLEHAFLEPECSVARPVDGGVEVYVGSQIPYEDQEEIARCLALPLEKVRVVGTLVGGAFGGKEDIAGQIHTALLASVTGRPVKILYDRRESMLVHPKRHATRIRVRLGAASDGRLLAAETELVGDTGAYASLGEKVMTRATTHSTGPYVVPHVKADCYAMYTNNPPAGAYRGFGVSQSCFAVESAMDELAHRLNIDPIELRRKNALTVGSATNTGQVLQESVGLVECIEQVQSELSRLTGGSDPFQARPVEGRPNLVRSWGFAVGYKNTGLGEGAPDLAEAEVELFDDGTGEVRTSSAEVGQGLVTVLQLIAAQVLGVPPDRLRVLLSDTALTPDGGPTTASRQTYVTGNAVYHAAQTLRAAMAATVAERLDLPPQEVDFVDGLVHAGAKQLAMSEVVSMMRAEGRETRVRYQYQPQATDPVGSGPNIHFAYSFSAQAAEVEVDLDTGEVRVLCVICANDVGRAINPLGLAAQVEGGVVMGVGTAVKEEYIVEQGKVFTDGLTRYRMPSILEAPQVTSIVVEHPTSQGPFGAKGVGEVVNVPTAPAITNAVYHACGVRIWRLPIDQDWLARELAKRKAAQSKV